MNHKSIIKMSLIIFGMLISFNPTSFAHQPVDLDPENKEPVLKIYDTLKPKYDNQLKNINVRADASDDVVIVEG
jgi:hypothetical protein